MVRQLLLRGVAAVVLGLGGWPVGLWIGELVEDTGYLPWGLALTVFSFILGALLAPYLFLWPVRWFSQRLHDVSLADIVMGLAGLMAGLLIAALFAVSLGRIPGTPGWVIPIVISIILGSLGAALFIFQGGPIVERIPALRESANGSRASRDMILLDTSAIIDGRITEVIATGFLQGTLGVPRFILNELHHIADSSEVLRRNRGRRGLEILNRLNHDPAVPVQVLEVENRNGTEVDARLVHLAQQLHAAIFTTDFNLNRVAELQGVRVLNVNGLANAIKPVVLPGEEMSIRVIQEGREAGQGVAFLDDGTMVVVEGGKRYINSHLDVAITRVLQTAQGRIIFAQPRGA